MESVPGRTLVFVQKKRSATWVCKKLSKDHNVVAVEIHGDRSQSQRESALRSFRAGDVTVMVATDVAARGLDIPDVTHVVNMDLPVSSDEFDSYVYNRTHCVCVHRILVCPFTLKHEGHVRTEKM